MLLEVASILTYYEAFNNFVVFGVVLWLQRAASEADWRLRRRRTHVERIWDPGAEDSRQPNRSSTLATDRRVAQAGGELLLQSLPRLHLQEGAPQSTTTQETMKHDHRGWCWTDSACFLSFVIYLPLANGISSAPDSAAVATIGSLEHAVVFAGSAHCILSCNMLGHDVTLMRVSPPKPRRDSSATHAVLTNRHRKVMDSATQLLRQCLVTSILLNSGSRIFSCSLPIVDSIMINLESLLHIIRLFEDFCACNRPFVHVFQCVLSVFVYGNRSYSLQLPMWRICWTVFICLLCSISDHCLYQLTYCDFPVLLLATAAFNTILQW